MNLLLFATCHLPLVICHLSFIAFAAAGINNNRKLSCQGGNSLGSNRYSQPLFTV
jgi:hypothetical protein